MTKRSKQPTLEKEKYIMGKKTSTMAIRSKEDIRQSMVDRGIITSEGKINETKMVENARKTVSESKDIVEKVSKSKTKKPGRNSKKVILSLEKIKTFDEKAELFDRAMKQQYGENYNDERGSVKMQIGDTTVYVNVMVSEMKIRSDKTENKTGLRVYLVKNGNSYSIGEYAGKLSIDRIVSRIQKIAKASMQS